MAVMIDPFVIEIPKEFLNNHSPEVRQYFQYLNRTITDIIERTGGPSSDLVAELEIAEKYPWPTTRTTQQEKTIDQSVQIPVRSFRSVTVENNYTAVDYDFINAKYGATITLPQYPIENSVIIVRNGDGSRIRYDGNGKCLNGSSTGQSTRKGTAIEFHYFLDSDEWFAR